MTGQRRAGIASQRQRRETYQPGLKREENGPSPFMRPNRLCSSAPLALRKSHAVGGVSSYGKELAPLGAPSASSAFFCRLPRWPSGGRRPCTVGAEGVETVIGEYVRRGYRS